MAKRLTFPAPFRVSDQTGTCPAKRSILKLSPKDRGLRHANHELVLVEEVVEQSLFTTRPWTEHDVLRLISHGGWFDFTRTDFQDKATKEFAMAAQLVQQDWLEG